MQLFAPEASSAAANGKGRARAADGHAKRLFQVCITVVLMALCTSFLVCPERVLLLFTACVVCSVVRCTANHVVTAMRSWPLLHLQPSDFLVSCSLLMPTL